MFKSIEKVDEDSVEKGNILNLFHSLNQAILAVVNKKSFKLSTSSKFYSTAYFQNQLNDCLNSTGESLAFDLNSLLNDCGCSNPSR